MQDHTPPDAPTSHATPGEPTPTHPRPPAVPAPARRSHLPDPGSPVRRVLTAIGIWVCVFAVFVIQQSAQIMTGAEMPSPITPTDPAELREQPALGMSEFQIQLRLIVPLMELAGAEHESVVRQLRAAVPSLPDEGEGWMTSGRLSAWSDQLRMAAVEAAAASHVRETDQAEEARAKAIERAERVRERIETELLRLGSVGWEGDEPRAAQVLAERAARDADLTLRALRAADLGADEADELRTRLGYAGRVAVVAHLAPQEPERQAVLGGGYTIMAVMVGVILAVGVVALAALTCFVIAIVQLARGRFVRRFVPPAPGGSVYSEMLLMFVIGFLALQLLAPIVMRPLQGRMSETEIITLSLGAQWLLALVIFYPLLVGVPIARWKADLGLHRGRGFIREAFAGVFAYLAMLPVFVLAVLVSLVLTLIWTMLKSHLGMPEGLPDNPILDLVQRFDTLGLVVLGSLIVLWAPLVEEIVFRGAFYRHLRARMGVFLAILISGVVFGVMHGYLFAMLLPVITLGFGFALMREWRDSLIAPITAHMLHNATIFLILILVVRGLG